MIFRRDSCPSEWTQREELYKKKSGEGPVGQHTNVLNFEKRARSQLT